jgi:hypothetical protein
VRANNIITIVIILIFFPKNATSNVIALVYYFVILSNRIQLVMLVKFHFSAFQQNPTNTETDARDLLQLALDRICELQRKLMQPNSCDAEGPREELTGRRF